MKTVPALMTFVTSHLVNNDIHLQNEQHKTGGIMTILG
jgi:hypothetical protein